MIDTLRLARALRDKGGFSQEAADATAEALNTAITAEAVTKPDLNAALAELKAELLKWMFGQTVVILAVLFAALGVVTTLILRALSPH